MIEFYVPGPLQLPKPEVEEEVVEPTGLLAAEVFGRDQDLVSPARRPARLFLAKSKAA